MDPCQCEIRPVVIKGHIGPPAFVVAVFAAGLRVIFFIDQPLVDILVAIAAPASDLPETPGCVARGGSPDVAGNTGNGKVRPVQPESTLIVLFRGIGKFFKPGNRVTLGTIGRNTLPGKLAFVVIGVTIDAPGKFQGIHKL